MPTLSNRWKLGWVLFPIVGSAVLAAFTNPPWDGSPSMDHARMWQAYSSLVERCATVGVAYSNPPSPGMTRLRLVQYKAQLSNVLASAWWLDPGSPISTTNHLTADSLLAGLGRGPSWWTNTELTGLSVSSNGLPLWTQLVAKVVWQRQVVIGNASEDLMTNFRQRRSRVPESATDPDTSTCLAQTFANACDNADWTWANNTSLVSADCPTSGANTLIQRLDNSSVPSSIPYGQAAWYDLKWTGSTNYMVNKYANGATFFTTALTTNFERGVYLWFAVESNSMDYADNGHGYTTNLSLIYSAITRATNYTGPEIGTTAGTPWLPESPAGPPSVNAKGWVSKDALWVIKWNATSGGFNY